MLAAFIFLLQIRATTIIVLFYSIIWIFFSFVISSSHSEKCKTASAVQYFYKTEPWLHLEGKLWKLFSWKLIPSLSQMMNEKDVYYHYLSLVEVPNKRTNKHTSDYVPWPYLPFVTFLVRSLSFLLPAMLWDERRGYVHQVCQYLSLVTFLFRPFPFLFPTYVEDMNNEAMCSPTYTLYVTYLFLWWCIYDQRDGRAVVSCRV